MNKVILIGNLVRDPEMRVNEEGLSITKFTLANNYGSKGSEQVLFIEIIAFGNKAEIVSRFFSKGKKILVEGRLKQENWEGKDGTKKSKLVLILEQFEFIESSGRIEEPQEGVQEPVRYVITPAAIETPF